MGRKVDIREIGQVDDRAKVEVLVRRLVALVGGKAAAEQVLLDLTVDGIRCRLEITDSVDTVETICALSPRESEIVRMVAQGYPNKTIATVLEISSFTVSSYIRRLFVKLGVNSRASMVALVIERHLIPSESRRPT